MSEEIKQTNLKAALDWEFERELKTYEVLNSIVPTTVKKVYEGAALKQSTSVYVPTSDIAIDENYNLWVRNVAIGNKKQSKATPTLIMVDKGLIRVVVPDSEASSISFLEEPTEEYIPLMGERNLSFTNKKVE